MSSLSLKMQTVTALRVTTTEDSLAADLSESIVPRLPIAIRRRNKTDHYRFFFYSADFAEPPHIHVERDASKAKFGLIR